MSAGIWSDIKVWWKQWRCPHPPWRIVGYSQRALYSDIEIQIKHVCRECGKEWK